MILLLMTRISKYKDFLEIDEVKRWYDNLKAKSPITAEVYLRTLGLYCEQEKTTPEKIISNFKESNDNGKQFKNRFTDYIRKLESEHKAGSYVVRFKKVLKSWIRSNDLDVTFNVNIANADRNLTTEDERIPNEEEMSRILRKASTRGKVSICFMAFSGLRPETLGSHLGDDGLKFKDIRDIGINDEGISFKQLPATLLVRPNLSKARHRYFTFIPEETVKYLNDYVKERRDHGEKITEDSPVIGFDVLKRGNVPRNKFLRTVLITRDIKDAMTNSGLEMRPYVMRSYFATALDISESKGFISHPWRMFIMGHKGDIEARYSTNKRLPPDMLEEMRDAYSKCLQYLIPEYRKKALTEEDKNQWKEEFKREYLRLFFGDKEIDDLKLLDLQNEELQRKVKEKMGMNLNNGHRQKVVQIKEVESMIEKGWEYVNAIPGNKAIVKLPDRL